MEFMVGDLVKFSMHDLHISNHHKFSAHFIGPFKVLKYISKHAYCIELPPIYSALHNVFHVSKLKLYVSDGSNGICTNVQPVLVEGEERYKVKKIIAEYSHVA